MLHTEVNVLHARIKAYEAALQDVRNQQQFAHQEAE